MSKFGEWKFGSFGSEWEPVAGMCEQRNELSACICGGELNG